MTWLNSGWTLFNMFCLVQSRLKLSQRLKFVFPFEQLLELSWLLIHFFSLSSKCVNSWIQIAWGLLCYYHTSCLKVQLLKGIKIINIIMQSCSSKENPGWSMNFQYILTKAYILVYNTTRKWVRLFEGLIYNNG